MIIRQQKDNNRTTTQPWDKWKRRNQRRGYWRRKNWRSRNWRRRRNQRRRNRRRGRNQRRRRNQKPQLPPGRAIGYIYEGMAMDSNDFFQPIAYGLQTNGHFSRGTTFFVTTTQDIGYWSNKITALHSKILYQIGAIPKLILCL